MGTRQRLREHTRWRADGRMPGQRLKKKKWIAASIILVAAFDWFFIVFGIEVILPCVLKMAPPYLPKKYAQVYTHISALRGHISGPNPVLAFSPDSKTLATSLYREARLWDVETGEHLLTLETDMNQVRALAFHSDGKTVVGVSEQTTSTNSYQFMVWDISSPDLKSAEPKRPIRLRKTWTDEAPLDPRANTSQDTRTVFSQDQRNVIRIGYSGSIWELDFTHDRLVYQQVVGLKSLERMQSAAFHFTTTPTDKIGTRWSRREHHYVPFPSTIVLNRQDTRSLLFFTAPEHYVMALIFSPDGKTLVSGGYRLEGQLWDQLWDIPIGEIRLWDVDTRRQRAFMQAPMGRVNNLAFSPDGQTLASGMSWRNTILIWDVSNRRLLSVLTGHGSDITALVFAPDSITLASVDREGVVHLWDITGRTNR